MDLRYISSEFYRILEYSEKRTGKFTRANCCWIFPPVGNKSPWGLTKKHTIKATLPCALCSTCAQQEQRTKVVLFYKLKLQHPCWPFSLSVMCQVCSWAFGESQKKAMMNAVLGHPRASGELTSGWPPKVKVGQDSEPQKSNKNRWLESWAWGTREGQTGADWVSPFYLQGWGNLNRKILLTWTHCDEEIKSDANKYMPIFPL